MILRRDERTVPSSPRRLHSHVPCCCVAPRQAVSTLLAEMEAVLQLRSSAAVLEASARTFLSLCGDKSSGGSAARAARDALVQSWVEKLTALLGDSLKVGWTIISLLVLQIRSGIISRLT